MRPGSPPAPPPPADPAPCPLSPVPVIRCIHSAKATAGLRPHGNAPGKRSCSKGHLTQKPRLVENCRGGGRGCGGVRPRGPLHGPRGLAPTPALSSTHCQARSASERPLQAGPQAGLRSPPGRPPPFHPPPAPSRGAGGARGGLRAGPLTFRQSWGCVSTREYCTWWRSSVQGLGQPPLRPRPRPPSAYSPRRVRAGPSAPAGDSGPLAPGASTGSRGRSRDRRAPSSGPGSLGGIGWRPIVPRCLQGPSPPGLESAGPTSAADVPQGLAPA